VFDRGPQLGALTHVRLTGDDPPPGLLDQTFGLGQVLRAGHWVRVRFDRLADVDGDDVGTFLGLPQRMRTALATARTGDERDLALQPTCHGTPLVFGAPGSARALMVFRRAINAAAWFVLSRRNVRLTPTDHRSAVSTSSRSKGQGLSQASSE